MTDSKRVSHPLAAVLFLYLLCFVFRYIEYFIVRTDATIIGEAVLHKLAGIAILVVASRHIMGAFSEIGFNAKDGCKKALLGLGFGACVFFIAYGAEIIIALAKGDFKSLSLYVTTYAVDKNTGAQTGLLFFAICALGNVINVVMEEGVFRGLFQKLLEQKYAFMTSAVVASCLFGLWHVISPIRSFCDGDMSMAGMLANIIMLVITSGLVGFKFALMTKLTGSLYMAMGDHFFNNTIVNILHVVSSGGADELMFLRITIAQTLSFAAVLVYYLKRRKIAPAKRSV